MPEDAKTGLRLVKYLSSSGRASRRAAAELIKAGRVKVDGKTVLDPAMTVAPAARVELDGEQLTVVGEKEYIMLHKPAGYVCTAADRFAERRAIELIDLGPDVRLFSAGRLDKESEGLILFSTDGDFVARLTHPRYGIAKEYLVTTAPPLGAPELARIRRGIPDDGEQLTVAAVEPLPKTPEVCRFTLLEGKKREIRRLVRAVGARTVRLVRVKIGELELGSLPSGQWRRLTAEERRKALAGKGPGADFSAR
jgi:23S rRNA pseudouridine2605 synthase